MIRLNFFRCGLFSLGTKFQKPNAPNPTCRRPGLRRDGKQRDLQQGLVRVSSGHKSNPAAGYVLVRHRDELISQGRIKND